MRFKEVPSDLLFQPRENRKKQTLWEGAGNFYPSVTTPYFQKQIELGIRDPGFQEPNGIGRIFGQCFYATQHEADLNAQEVAFLTEHQQTLRDHFDARLCAFFRQLVDVYGTPFQFENGIVEDQLEHSNKLPWICIADGRIDTLSFQSAHYGTLPCIIAYPEAEYRAWNNNRRNFPKPAGHVFGKFSDTYRSNNGCAGHITVVNKADSLMDHKGGSEVNVRPLAIDLLNASAQQVTDPLSGMRIMIGKLRKSVGILLANQRNPSLQFIFQTYRDHLLHVQTMIDQQPNDFFNLLLGVRIDERDARIHKLIAVIYPHRFKTLQTLSACQSQIAAHVERAKQRFLAGLSRKPPHFDQAFKAYTIISAKNISEKLGKVLQRHFCTSAEQAQQAWDTLTTQTGKPAAIQRRCTQGQAEIYSMLLDIQKLTHNFSVDESLLRANLLRKLRHLHFWTQTVVADKVNQLSPSENMYQQKISRLELGRKRIPDSLTAIFSEVFDVDKSVFNSGAKVD